MEKIALVIVFSLMTKVILLTMFQLFYLGINLAFFSPASVSNGSSCWILDMNQMCVGRCFPASLFKV